MMKPDIKLSYSSTWKPSFFTW